MLLCVLHAFMLLNTIRKNYWKDYFSVLWWIHFKAVTWEICYLIIFYTLDVFFKNKGKLKKISFKYNLNNLLPVDLHCKNLLHHVLGMNKNDKMEIQVFRKKWTIKNDFENLKNLRVNMIAHFYSHIFKENITLLKQTLKHYLKIYKPYRCNVWQ